jgi:hypothetical protein
MDVTTLSTLVQSLLTLIVLTIVVFGLWPEQRTDLFRQQMFCLRDELFDFAADRKIDFNDPAYILLRQLMNGFIRYAHNLTPFRTFMAFLRWKCFGQQQSGWAHSLNDAIANVSDQPTREALQKFHSRTASLVLSQLVLSPGLVLLLAPVVAVIAVLYYQWSSLRAIYNAFSDRVPMSFLEEEAAKS